ncbi:MAG TPA: RsiV family protein, partial [Devosia sp.]|nr:RsiV family protein [Devosia sp.]
DIFTGKRWKAALLDLTVEALKAEHGDELMLDDTQYIAGAVIDPERWDLSDPYSLIVQFQPYEVSYYAYGAPTARIPWSKLQDYLAEDADGYRY